MLCEVEGTCGAGVPGEGADYQQKVAIANAAERTRDQALAKADDLDAQVTDARAQLFHRQEQANLALVEPSRSDVPPNDNSLAVEVRSLASIVFGSPVAVIALVLLVSTTVWESLRARIRRQSDPVR